MVSATEALNVAKETGNAIQFHDKSLAEKAMKRRQMLVELREAIASESLKVVYQPKYDLRTMSVSGAEVLVRWIHPVEGFIPRMYLSHLQKKWASPVPFPNWW